MTRVAASTGNRAHALNVRMNDLYETPEVATRALLRAEPWIADSRVWEPACGPGSIVRTLRAAGAHVVATDLVDYASPDQDAHGRDFLMEQAAPAGTDSIVTNPPFKNANEFVEHGLRLVPCVVMLLRLAFLESESRSAILDGGKLARVHVFRKRLPMMRRGGWAGEKMQAGMIAFAWFVWDRNHRGPTELHRVSWERT